MQASDASEDRLDGYTLPIRNSSPSSFFFYIHKFSYRFLLYLTTPAQH